MTELVEKRIRQLYVNWADEPLPILNDRTPREAIQTPEGLEQVKFLLHTYENMTKLSKPKLKTAHPFPMTFYGSR